jgi:hypothetical protein
MKEGDEDHPLAHSQLLNMFASLLETLDYWRGATPNGRLGLIDTISNNWTSQERIVVASALLNVVVSDFDQNRYGEPGRPNITSVLHVFHLPPAILNDSRQSLHEVLNVNTDCPEGNKIT